MAHAFPNRPFSRTYGQLEAFDPSIGSAHVPDEAAAGIRVHVKGWIVDGNISAAQAAWIDIGGVAIPVELTRNRPDVAQAFAAKESAGMGIGFETAIVMPPGVPPGKHSARIIALSKMGRGLYAEHTRIIRIAYARTEVRLPSASDDVRGTVLRVRDTQPAALTLGRGTHTIREESSLHVSGSAPGAMQLHIIAVPQNGAPAAWDVPAAPDGTFDSVLWIGGLTRGVYEVLLCRDDATAQTAVLARCFIEIAGPHYLPPLLNALQTPPHAGIVQWTDAGSRAAGSAAVAFNEGRPIAVSGWCIDPAASAPPLAVYAEIDQARPIPLSHGLPDPRPHPQANGLGCGFGGVLDTTRVAPGSHHLRILGAAVSGAGWYVILDRDLVINPAPRAVRSP